MPESTHVKIPHCWKSHVKAQLCPEWRENGRIMNIYLGVTEEENCGVIFKTSLHHNFPKILTPLINTIVLGKLNLDTVKVRPVLVAKQFD